MSSPRNRRTWLVTKLCVRGFRLSVTLKNDALLVPEGVKNKTRRGKGKKKERAWKQWFDAESESREGRISRPDYERDRATLHRATLTLANTLCTVSSTALSSPWLIFEWRKASSDVCAVIPPPTDPAGFRSARLRLLRDFRMINRLKYTSVDSSVAQCVYSYVRGIVFRYFVVQRVAKLIQYFIILASSNFFQSKLYCLDRRRICWNSLILWKCFMLLLKLQNFDLFFYILCSLKVRTLRISLTKWSLLLSTLLLGKLLLSFSIFFSFCCKLKDN